MELQIEIFIPSDDATFYRLSVEHAYINQPIKSFHRVWVFYVIHLHNYCNDDRLKIKWQIKKIRSDSKETFLLNAIVHS